MALDETQRRTSAALMRVNHSGEVCAQALYQGQALASSRPEVRRALERAGRETAQIEQQMAALGDDGGDVLLRRLFALDIGARPPASAAGGADNITVTAAGSITPTTAGPPTSRLSPGASSPVGPDDAGGALGARTMSRSANTKA